jgi:hypothetical protein
VVDLLSEVNFGWRKCAVLWLVAPIILASIRGSAKATEILVIIAGVVNGDPKLRHFLWLTFFAAFKVAGGNIVDFAHSLIEISLAGSISETANVLADVFHEIPKELASILLRKLSVFKRLTPR